MSDGKTKARLWRYWPRLLFLVPFLAMLWVPSYNRIEPELGGIPFFYWYQLAWILIGAAIVLVVYAIETKITRVTRADRARSGAERRAGGHSLTLDLTATDRLRRAVPVRHLARLRGGALAQGRSQSPA